MLRHNFDTKIDNAKNYLLKVYAVERKNIFTEKNWSEFDWNSGKSAINCDHLINDDLCFKFNDKALKSLLSSHIMCCKWYRYIIHTYVIIVFPQTNNIWQSCNLPDLSTILDVEFLYCPHTECVANGIGI